MHADMKGVALVMVLFILVLMTVLVTWLTDDLVLAVRRSENLRDMEQAWQLAVGSELWGRAVLTRDAGESGTDHLGEGWNQLGRGVEVEQGRLDTTILDLQGRFNINNLMPEANATRSRSGKAVPTVWTNAFRRLLIVLELDDGLADAVLDWLDADGNVRGVRGAEDSDYLGAEIPYRAANRMLSDVSELKWIKGFDADKITTLAPYVTALPATGVAININTAPQAILRILGKEILSPGEAEVLARGQADGGYSVDDFLRHDMMAAEHETAEPLIDDKSNYFLVSSAVAYGRASLVLNSIVQRDKLGSTVIRRTQTYGRQ